MVQPLGECPFANGRTASALGAQGGPSNELLVAYDAQVVWTDAVPSESETSPGNAR